MRSILSEAELKAVEDAIQEAERRTSGEIVPYIVERSASYPIAYWRAGGAAALLMLFATIVLGYVYTGWGLGWLFTTGGTGAALFVAAFMGAGLARFVPAIERFFAGQDALLGAVRDRSARAFVDEEVFDTRERTGILLFISLFEQRVEVVGDSGINAKVDDDDWARVVADILEGIRRGQTGEGLVKAVARCGKLLEEKGVEIREDDSNELSDSVRLEPR